VLFNVLPWVLGAISMARLSPRPVQRHLFLRAVFSTTRDPAGSEKTARRHKFFWTGRGENIITEITPNTHGSTFPPHSWSLS